MNDLVEVLLDIRPRVEAHGGHFCGAQDDGQRVVEVVGDATGHSGERLDPARLLQRLLRALALVALACALPFGLLERQALLLLARRHPPVHVDLLCEALDDVELGGRSHEAQQRENEPLPNPQGTAARIPHLNRQGWPEAREHDEPCRNMDDDDRRQRDRGTSTPEAQRP